MNQPRSAAPTRARRLAEMTSQEARRSAGAGDIVLVPAGALEQHGPAMPLGTDTIRAEAVCEDLARRRPGDVVIGPVIPVGVSPHHLAMAGTLTLTTSTFTALVREIALGLRRQGWRKILVITGHGGNNAALTTVAQDLLAVDRDLEFAWSPLTSLAGDVVREAGVSEIHGHCGEAETSQMLHVAPDLVREDLLEAGVTTMADLDPTSALARSFSQPTLTRPYDQLSPNGVLGDPRRATAELGERILARIIERLDAFVEHWSRL
ncbi:creatininase family protein [Brachybacterium halotolerans subsp. kimchii]|uniref:creatininase family protein n=1 Tax=Brachybacterium halotolerans TaxID=2795215 RepID=UPI001E427F50|nr:creatininase family protein [Brachybacterium halotolerans]UEJ81682.1 creatininase family protein [Brachybacterium halotolerans subsp. kimchii]